MLGRNVLAYAFSRLRLLNHRTEKLVIALTKSTDFRPAHAFDQEDLGEHHRVPRLEAEQGLQVGAYQPANPFKRVLFAWISRSTVRLGASAAAAICRVLVAANPCFQKSPVTASRIASGITGTLDSLGGIMGAVDILVPYL